MRAAYLAAAIGVVAVTWWYVDVDAVADEVGEVVDDAAQAVDEFTGGFMKLSDMAKVNLVHASHPNVRAFLKVIRRGEGTTDAAGYSRIFGGEQFTSYLDHPRKVVTRQTKNGPLSSSAAGAYQFLASTWDETARIMRLNNFNPNAQDLAAVGRIAARGALDDVIAGRFETAVRKCAKEWASLPFSPYGQPVISMSTALTVFANNGGTLA